MALNRSPESVSPQNEFCLVYYYCSNLWPPGWGQFWPQGYHMNRIDIGPNIIVQGQMIKALLLLVSEKKNFKVFLLCSYVSNLWPPGRGPILPHGHHMNNLGRGPLGDAIYTKHESSVLSSFREEEFWSFPCLFLCFELVTPRAGPVLTLGASYEQSL